MKRSPRGEFVESRGFSRGHSADPHSYGIERGCTIYVNGRLPGGMVPHTVHGGMALSSRKLRIGATALWDLDPPAHPGSAHRQRQAAVAAADLPHFQLHKVGDPSGLTHHLRESWRAQRWAVFIRSNTRAAAALAPHYGPWLIVADRAKEGMDLCSN